MNAPMKTPAKGEATPVAANDVAEAKAAVPTEEAPKAAKPRGRGRRLALMVSVPVLLAAGGAWFFFTGGRYVETDNAYVQQNKISVSADVSGRIASVAVADNQFVKAGDVLFTLDPQSYDIALSQADAALATARVNVEQLRVAYDTANAKLEAAQATLAIRQKEWDRTNNLQQQGISAESALDDARLALQQAESTVALEQQDVAGATAALGGDPKIDTDAHPAVRAALAARDAAQRNLDKTVVHAPADGIVSQVGSLNVGQFISTGATIATLVETGAVWVEANFKETQLFGLEPGMPAEVTVDALPGVTFEGHVASIGAATGSEFALIPAQNATGNWVKVTQRIPVNVEIAGNGLDSLRAGMSAVVNVDTKPEGSVPEASEAK